MEPIANILHRHVSVFVVLSARAIAPWAWIGAKGKGSRSMSEVIRKSA
jgi:hypothetical protein